MATILQTKLCVPGMDCPSEERLIRMVLDPMSSVTDITVALGERTVTVTHADDPQTLLTALEPLKLGATLLSSQVAPESAASAPSQHQAAGEARVLKQLLAINGAMFVIELVVGWLADSTGLLADSIDMLADALVYAISLVAVGRSAALQHRAARASGVAQLVLALGVFAEVGRRAVFGSEPASLAMMLMSAVALAANLSCVWLLRRHREGGVHMQASWIFTANDALANLGVILAGALVLATGSAIPDLVIGTLIALIVGRGALRILRLPKAEAKA